jgi:serine/threonine protein kinase
LGLPQLFTEISAAAAFGGTVAKSSSSHSDSKGHLEIGTSNPTLAKRYRLQEIIGVGTFSRIFKATDIYSGNSVAVKVMRVGYHVLGTREVAFLRYFNSKEVRGCKHCKSSR